MKEEIAKVIMEYLAALAERNKISGDTGIVPTFQGFINWLMTGQI